LTKVTQKGGKLIQKMDIWQRSHKKGVNWYRGWKFDKDHTKRG